MSAAKPVYQKLKSDILAMIENGSVLPGEILPPEKELSEKYGISRGSTRVALSELEAEKLIEKKPGRGAFVCDPLKADKPAQTKTIGIDLGDHIIGSTPSYYKDFARSVNEASIESNCRIQLVSDYEIENHVGNDLDGLLITRYEQHTAEKVAAAAKKIPIILLNRCVTTPEIGYVIINDVMGMFQATEYLIKQGHERIAFISNTCFDGQRRRRGYISALKTYELPINHELIISSQPGNEIFDSMRKIMDSKHPTAIISASASYHMNFVDPIMRELKIAIPDEVSLICFDDIEKEVFHYGPPLTCVRQPLSEMGRTALKDLANVNGPPIRETFQTELIIRQSCKDIVRPKIIMEDEVKT